MRFVAIVCVAAQILATSSLKQSLLNPPWKHCVHNLYAKRGWQDFVSPGYPHGITTQTQCSWIISSNPSQKIKLAFYTLNLTGSINSCFTQFVEIWDLKTGSSMGRFCGGRRPGDYVTHGYMVRVDLKADTAAPGHKGFMMKYKFTKEASGFKPTLAFPSKPKPTTKKPNAKNKGKLGSSTESMEPQKPVVFDSNGGRVNLHLRQRLRDRNSRKPFGNQKRPSLAQRPALPQPIQRQSNSHLSSPGKINISIDDDQDSLPFELWIIILIGIGGLLFLLFLGFLTWLCFCDHDVCRKRKRNENTSAQQTLKAHHNAQKQQELPGTHPSFPQPTNVISPGQVRAQPFYVPLTATNHLQPVPARHGVVATPVSHQNQYLPGDLSYTVYNNKNASVHLQKKANAPTESGYLHEHQDNPQRKKSSPENKPYCKTPSSSSNDETNASEGASQQQSQQAIRKQIPTLKRKFCQWEKDEIKRGTIKF